MVQTPQNNVFGWYEANLPQAERKQRGHFSTPPRLVEYILDACGYISTSDLSRIRVLDPACGSGNFLAAAARRLVTSQVGTDVSRPHPSYCPEPHTAQPAQTLQPVNHRKMLQIVQRNLWGFDPDPIACFLAEMQLRETVQHATGTLFPRKTRLHIHQADGLTIPWEMCEGVDLFLANPPYLATKNNDLTGYRLSHSGGQIDSYLLFLELAMHIVRPGGWLAIVLPDPVLARANASRERTRLLETFTIHHLWHLANVFNAQVGAVVLIAQKCTPSNTHAITWVREKWSRSGNGFKHAGNGTMGDCSQSEDGRPPTPTPTPTIGEDGRPQGAPPIHPTSPVPTMYEREQPRHIVGTGVGWTWGGVHCGRPSSSPVNDGDSCGRPSSSSVNDGDSCGRSSSPTGAEETTIPQSLFLQQPRAEFRYLLHSEQGVIIERLRSVWDASSVVKQNFAPLSSFLSIRRGEELGRENSRLVQIPASPSNLYDNNSSWLPILRGGIEIRPYATPTAQYCIARGAVAKPLTRYLSPKLLVVKSTNRLQATLDIKGHVALQTLYLLHPLSLDASNDELYFFLALLNSRLLQEYVYTLYTAYKWVQPQIEQHVLAQLPIPVIVSDCKNEIIERSRHMIVACDKSGPVVEWSEPMQCLYARQERAIRTLYASALPGLFPKEM
ncbi:MAG: N-6 DNA methylase [Ktedonobacteraceae bacterium]